MDLTIEKLANLLDCGCNFLGLIERGKRGLSIVNLQKMAFFFNISIDELTGFTNKIGQPNENITNEFDAHLDKLLSISKVLSPLEINFLCLVAMEYIKLKNSDTELIN